MFLDNSQENQYCTTEVVLNLLQKYQCFGGIIKVYLLPFLLLQLMRIQLTKFIFNGFIYCMYTYKNVYLWLKVHIMESHTCLCGCMYRDVCVYVHVHVCINTCFSSSSFSIFPINSFNCPNYMWLICYIYFVFFFVLFSCNSNTQEIQRSFLVKLKEGFFIRRYHK